MKFTDFEPKELIGKKVLNTVGSTYHSSRKLSVITEVTKNFFKIKDSDSKFRLVDGDAPKPAGRMYWSNVDNCVLITDEEHDKYVLEFTTKRLMKKLLVEIPEKLKKASFDKLQKIQEILNS